MLTAVLLSIAVGLATSYVEGLSAWTKIVAFWIVVVAVGTWLLAEAATQVVNIIYFGKGRYAVLLFVLDPKNRLLLVRHPYHNRLIPPGGRLKIFELPHAAVSRVLQEEAGLKDFSFAKEFHSPARPYTDTVTVLPEPHRVQKEDRRQRALVRFHYAFVYVLRAPENAVNFATPTYEPRWFTWDEVDGLVPPQRPFDDIVKRYRDILDLLPTNRFKR